MAALVCGVATGAWAQDQEKTESEKSGKFSEETLAAQVLLDRVGFSTGEIDGMAGRNVEEITKLFQEAAGLETSGELDEQTSAVLMQAAGGEPVLREYAITETDAAGPFVDEIPEKMEEQAKLPLLGYKDMLELLGEKFHADPAMLKELNPDAKFATGETIQVPNVQSPPIGSDGKYSRELAGEKKQKDDSDSDGDKKGEDESDKKDEGEKNKDDRDGDSDTDSETTETAVVDGSTSAGPAESMTSSILSAGAAGSTMTLAFQPNREPEGDLTITVTKSTSILMVEDEAGKPIFAAPVTTGSEHDPLPIGEWKVNGTEYNPPFNYNPELFWDAEDDEKKAKLPPGANGPVGLAWIDLSKEHYGLHGTPEPGRIGHTASHGCVRLTNWDVLRLARLVKPGTKVLFKE